MTKLPCNFKKRVKLVNHKDLKRFSEDSPFKSECPVCDDGILLLGVDLDKMKFREYDICISCGQRVKYKDIKELNKMFKKC